MEEDDDELRSLPPGVAGEIQGYFVLEIGELLFKSKHLEVAGDTLVEPIWWGHDGSNAALSPSNMPSKGGRISSRLRYPVRCPLRVFRKYLSEMGRLDLKVRSSSSSAKNAPRSSAYRGRLIGVVSIPSVCNRAFGSPGSSSPGEYFPISPTTTSSSDSSAQIEAKCCGYLFVRVAVEPADATNQGPRCVPKGKMIPEKAGVNGNDGNTGPIKRSLVDRRPSPPRRVIESVPIPESKEPSLVDQLLSAESMNMEVALFRFDRSLVTDYVEDLSPTKRPGRRLPASMSAVFAEIRAPSEILRKLSHEAKTGHSAGIGRLSARDIRDGVAKFTGKPPNVSFPIRVKDLGVLRGAKVEVHVTARILGVRMPVALGVGRFDVGSFLADGSTTLSTALEVECDEKLVAFQKSKRPLSLFQPNVGRLDAKVQLVSNPSKPLRYQQPSVPVERERENGCSTITEEDEERSSASGAASGENDKEDRERTIVIEKADECEQLWRRDDGFAEDLEMLRISAKREWERKRQNLFPEVGSLISDGSRRMAPENGYKVSDHGKSGNFQKRSSAETTDFEVPKELWYLCVSLREARNLTEEDRVRSGRSTMRGSITSTSTIVRPSRNYFAVIRVGSRENVFPTKTVWRTDEPDFDFRVRVPFLPSPEFLKSLATNCVVVEVWRRSDGLSLPNDELPATVGEDTLIGLARVPLRLAAFCLEQRNALSILAQSETPSVLVDGFIPIESLATSAIVGEIRLHVSLGTAAQVGFFLNSSCQSSAKIADVGVQAALRQPSPLPPPPALPPMAIHSVSKVDKSVEVIDISDEDPKTEPFEIPSARKETIEAHRGNENSRAMVSPVNEDSDDTDVEALDLCVRRPEPPLPVQISTASNGFSCSPAQLRLEVMRGMSLELPQSSQGGPFLSDPPHVYVSISNPRTNRVEVSPACIASCDPTWDWSVVFDLPSSSLDEDERLLAVKVWSISPAEKFFVAPGTQIKWIPRREDILVGKVTIDVFSILQKEPRTAGWFQISSPTQKLPRGLLKLGFHLFNPGSRREDPEEERHFLSRSSSEVDIRPDAIRSHSQQNVYRFDDTPPVRQPRPVPALLPAVPTAAEPSISGVSADSAFYSSNGYNNPAPVVHPRPTAIAMSSPVDGLPATDDRMTGRAPEDYSSQPSSLDSQLSERYLRPDASS